MVAIANHGSEGDQIFDGIVLDSPGNNKEDVNTFLHARINRCVDPISILSVLGIQDFLKS
jgi:hypothetical protein